MNVEHLVQMANQIGAFFDAMPDRDAALEGISNHIRRFWAPRMRDQLAVDAPGLAPIVVEAITRHPIQPTPTPFDADDAPSPGQRHELDGASEA